MQGAGCRVKTAGCRVQVSGFRVQGAGCRVQGAGCRVQGAGCRVHGAPEGHGIDEGHFEAVLLCHQVLAWWTLQGVIFDHQLGPIPAH